MKKLISTLSFIFIIGIVTLSAQCCTSATENNLTSIKEPCCENQKSGEVKVYYFHATRRCVTCHAVEAVSKNAIKEYYGDKVAFESINGEEAQNKKLVEKYQISGTSLLVVNGDKIVNLTNDAFINARNNPDKLKSKLKSTIDSMM